MDDTTTGQPGPGADDDAPDKGERTRDQVEQDAGDAASNPFEAAADGLEAGLERQGEDDDGTG